MGIEEGYYWSEFKSYLGVAKSPDDHLQCFLRETSPITALLGPISFGNRIEIHASKRGSLRNSEVGAQQRRLATLVISPHLDSLWMPFMRATTAARCWMRLKTI
ncbi:MAG: hypothetical protein Ct9H300mP8_05290 [Gammaproteobacteria bacterium]|nr:MAG: hypothetical protein Ct9H300mP8_05290 [Gammaproteobacteria bacterium]